MRFLLISAIEEASGDNKGKIKIPLFIVSLLGKRTPEFIFSYVLKKLNTRDLTNSTEDHLALKEIIRTISRVIIEASVNEELPRYNGVIFEASGEREKITISIE